jgi:hypothetical protein
MKTFTVEVRYSFTGNFTIEAETRAEAIRIAEEDCGCVGPTFHTSNDQHVKNWDFPIHPEVKAVSIS